MTQDRRTRILALEVRYRKLGFAAMESKLLLDAGIRTFHTPEKILRCIHPLLAVFLPCVVVVRYVNQKNECHRSGVISALRLIRGECIRRTIPVDFITNDEVNRAFHRNGSTKEQIAQAVAQVFPELRWKLPPTRHKRPWVSEGWNTALFDAVAAGITYFTRFEQTPTNPP